MTLQEGFDNFIFSRELQGLTEKTITNYSEIIVPFVAYIGPNRALDSIQATEIQMYNYGILKRPLKRASQATYIRHIKVFLCWLEDEYSLCYNAKKIKIPKSNRRQVKIYTPDEVKMIFDNITAESDWLTVRNKLIIALMYDSGLRQAEVCGLLKENVSVAGRNMIVCGKGNKERVVPLGLLTIKIMCEYNALCPFESPYVVCGRHGEQVTCNSVKLMVSKLSDTLPFDISSHKLRHNFATNYCVEQYEKNHFVDVGLLQYIMGHSDVETTQGYLHLAMGIVAAKSNISHLDKVASW